MPVVDIPKKVVCAALQHQFTEDEFTKLCFEFGIELDGVVTEKELLESQGLSTENASDEIIYKVEVPANRYDLLCIEGLSRALNAFRGIGKPPTYETTPPKHTIFVETSVEGVRPIVLCAVLRDIKFNDQTYQSFIDLQEKLHRNICRLRTLASVGTHDLDTVKGPFYYRAESPTDIKFAPLDNTKVVNGHELMAQLEKHAQLKQFLHIIRDKPKYPVIRDSNGVVMSLPPIINSDHSKITLNTKNVFIEVTAVDLNKAKIVLDTIVTMFSEHCTPTFKVEQVTHVIKTSKGETKEVHPDWTSPLNVTCDVSYLNEAIGINESAESILKYLQKMGLTQTKILENGKKINITVPPTRSDIMHPCDIMEDIAISYGFNNLKKVPIHTISEGKPLPVNKLSDSLRIHVSQQGYLELLNFILTTKADNYSNMNLPEDNLSVELSNPKGNIQIVRTSLLPGILNAIANNKSAPMPIQVFEVGDIVLRDPKSDVGASNYRQLSAVYASKNSAGFEHIHGLLDSVMSAMNVECKGWEKGQKKPRSYTIVEAIHPSFFPGRCANIVMEGEVVGIFGILHPTVLKNFKLTAPASALLLKVDPFL